MFKQMALSAGVLLILVPVALAQHFEPIGKIENPRGETGRGDVFGDELAFVGDRLFVTAPDAPGGGALYEFRDGVLLNTIQNPFPNSRLGRIAPLNDGLLVSGAGDTGTQLQFLQADGTFSYAFSPPADDIPFFGIGFAALAHTVAVGSLDNTKGSLSGAVHLYSETGEFQKTIFSPNAQSSGGFGNLVAPVGADKFIVGASNEWFNGIRSGAAYLYDDEGTLLASFFDPTPVPGNDLFARKLAAVGDLLLISDGTYVPSEGRSIYEFHAFDQAGNYLWTLPSPDPTKVNVFGSFIASTPGVLVFGDSIDNRNGEYSGVAHVFTSQGSLVETLIEPNAHVQSLFGASGIMSGDTLYVSAHGVGTRELPNREIGTVYQYQLVPEPSSAVLLGIGLALASYQLCRRRYTRR